MKHFLQSLSEILVGSQRRSPLHHEFITIGDQVFAVAHSREEMGRIMRSPGRKVHGYVYRSRM